MNLSLVLSCIFNQPSVVVEIRHITHGFLRETVASFQAAVVGFKRLGKEAFIEDRFYRFLGENQTLSELLDRAQVGGLEAP